MKRIVCCWCIVAFALTAVPAAFALGFRNPDQGARATGQGEAFVAQADDPSAIYYNPAGLTQITGFQFMSGSYVLFRDIRFKQSGTGYHDGITEPAFTPHLYLAWDGGTEKWRFGLGFNVPFGNAMSWGDQSPLHQLVTQGALCVYNIEPTVAYRINDQLSIGAGLNIYYGHTLSESYPAPEHLHFDGDGISAGATLGALWKINEQHSIGINYRSPFSIDFEGSTELATPFGNSKTDANATIDFPQSAAIGYAFRPIKKLKLEIDAEWTNWEALDKAVLHGSPLNGMAIPFHWKDSWFYEFGTQYDLNDMWAIRAGYIYSENTVPSASFAQNASVPDSNRHVLSAGLGYTTKRLNVDLVYQYSLSTDRTITGLTPAAGRWESQGHALMVSSTLKF